VEPRKFKQLRQQEKKKRLGKKSPIVGKRDDRAALTPGFKKGLNKEGEQENRQLIGRKHKGTCRYVI